MTLNGPGAPLKQKLQSIEASLSKADTSKSDSSKSDSSKPDTSSKADTKTATSLASLPKQTLSKMDGLMYRLLSITVCMALSNSAFRSVLRRYPSAPARRADSMATSSR